MHCRLVIEDRKWVEIVDRFYVLHLHELTQFGLVFDDTKVNRNFLHAAVQVVEHKQGLADVRKFLTKLFVTTRLRLVCGEMRFIESDLDDALVRAQHHTPARPDRSRQ